MSETEQQPEHQDEEDVEQESGYTRRAVLGGGALALAGALGLVGWTQRVTNPDWQPVETPAVDAVSSAAVSVNQEHRRYHVRLGIREGAREQIDEFILEATSAFAIPYDGGSTVKFPASRPTFKIHALADKSPLWTLRPEFVIDYEHGLDAQLVPNGEFKEFRWRDT